MNLSPPKTSAVFALLAQPILAEGLARLIEPCPDLRFAGYVAHPDDVPAEVLRSRPALLIADQSFGLAVICDLLAVLHRQGSPLRAVLWAQRLSAAEQRAAIDSGLSGVLDRGLGTAEMLECFRSVLDGHVWTAPLADGHQLADQHIASRLTRREREVMVLVQEGLKNREIAARMKITQATVKVHMLHIFEKAGVRDRHELSLKALRLLSHLPKEPQLSAAACGVRP